MVQMVLMKRQTNPYAMRHIKLSVAALASIILLGLVSCSKLDGINEESAGTMHTITITTAPLETKTAVAVDMTNNTLAFSWSGDDGDRLVIKENGVAGTISGFSIDANGVASFQATFPPASPAPDSYEYTGFLAANRTSGGYPRILDKQYPTATSFDPDADVLFAKPITTTSLPNSFSMQYQRAVAITRLTLTGLPNNIVIDKIYIDGGSTRITGALSMDQNYNITPVGFESHLEITLPTGSVTSNNQITTYFTILPLQDVELTVTAHAMDGYVYSKALTPKTFSTKQVKALTVTNLTSYLDANISFADSNVKTICVNNWDTNHDGELSYQEASAVTSLGTVFTNQDIASFDEFQYFTGITHIDDYAFSNCVNLCSIILPNTITSIGVCAFADCGYQDPNRYNYDMMMVDQNSEGWTVEEQAYHYWQIDYKDSGLNAIVLPSGVTTIGEGAFFNTPLSSITLPNGLTSIGASAFAQTSLTSIELPATLTYIGDRAFSWSRIQSIVLPNNIQTIGYEMFRSARDLHEITLPTNLKSIGDGVFTECDHLASILIPQSVTSIGVAAFRECLSLTGINIPLGVTTISDEAFFGCRSLTNIAMPNVTNIGYMAFAYCYHLSSISIPSDGTSIGNSAFSGCTALSTVTMPGVISIGEYAFNNCSTLPEITIPSGVTSIGQKAFANCTSLNKAILAPVTPPTINSNCWENTTCYFFVPSSSVSTYQAATGWSTYAGRIYDVGLMP